MILIYYVPAFFAVFMWTAYFMCKIQDEDYISLLTIMVYIGGLIVALIPLVNAFVGLFVVLLIKEECAPKYDLKIKNFFKLKR